MSDLKLEGCTVEELWEDGSVMLTLGAPRYPESSDFMILESEELERLYFAARAERRLNEKRS